MSSQTDKRENLVLMGKIQTYQYGAQFAAITAATMVAYTTFTIWTTAWRTKFRKQANAADNKGATVAVDSLINYEAVKVSVSPTSEFTTKALCCSILTTKPTRYPATTRRSKPTKRRR